MPNHATTGKKLLLVTADRLAQVSLSRELREIVGEMDETVTLECRSLEELGPLPTADLCVVSTPAIVTDIVAAWGRLECPVIVCRRSIDHHRIQPLLDLPEGTAVLLVITYEEDAISLQQWLQGAGITHLQYIPWSPGHAVPPGVQHAVTPGKIHLIPDTIPSVIDIGTRTLDATSVMEILFRLQLPPDHLERFSIKLTKELVGLYREVLKQTADLKADRALLREIFNQTLEGIALLDEEGRLLLANQRFSEYRAALERTYGPWDSKTVNWMTWLRLPASVRSHLLISDRTHLLMSVTPMGDAPSVQWLVFLRDVTEIRQLQQEVYEKLADAGHLARYTLKDIVSESPVMVEAKDLAMRIARSDGTVLLLGESGVGKELFAHAIHNASTRANRPFVAVNFSALSESLLESELFGYEEGAFTGAKKGGKAGLLELANEGTLFLDEIGDASPAIQLRLLRALQERQILRVGGTRIRQLNIRVIAATHRDLEQAVAEGTFRQDLYYRLAVFPIEVPPLRDRQEDIIPLFTQFLKHSCSYRMDPSLPGWLLKYSWPGNVRELQNCAAYVSGVARGTIGWSDLPPTIRRALEGASPRGENGLPISARRAGQPTDPALVARARAERLGIYREIAATMARWHRETGRGIGRDTLARLLGAGITPQQLRSRLHLLQQAGYVAAGRGRQGTVLTAEGETWLGESNGRQNHGLPEVDRKP